MKKMYHEFLAGVKKADPREFSGGFNDRVIDWDKYIIKRMPEITSLPWDKVHRVRIKSK